LARSHIGENDQVLDVGCGSGSFAAHIPSGNFVGLELNAKARDAASSKGLMVLGDSVQRHAEKNRARYDAVCAFQVLEHIGELRSFIQACVDCLKPGGRLIIATPSYDSFVSCVTNYALNLPPHHLSWWSDEALRRLAGAFALDVAALVHEPLSATHRRMYCSVLAGRALGFYTLKEAPLIDLSMRFRILSKLAWIAARFLERGMSDGRLLPRGHAVTAVYKKRYA
jgi:SAM-dependent methyltransferase